MKFECILCDKIFKKPGALIFLPPLGYVTGKYHLCVSCWEKLAKKLKIESSTKVLMGISKWG